MRSIGYRVYTVQQADGTAALLTVPAGASVQMCLNHEYPGGTLLHPEPVYEASWDQKSGGYWSGD
ncbi:hypothetical protein [Sulfobacillus sp. hq2]|uniref:hypothetical protein n=1 Tax=Sulfobacillus TaxID=28033 RepID=UPI000CD12708|nr:hypothetical protein [Sulfobacillus sp. hq2]POB12302.1 hypothetical protein CO251_00095 [Sulfobacillus sp. hq2]